MPGTKAHCTHKHCTVALLKKHLLHRDPNLNLSKKLRPELYEILFNVKWYKAEETSDLETDGNTLEGA